MCGQEESFQSWLQDCYVVSGNEGGREVERVGGREGGRVGGWVGGREGGEEGNVKEFTR